MRIHDFTQWFDSVTSKFPFPYQTRLATTQSLPILLNVPTGAGKTAAVILSWLWRRRYATPEIRQQTPRRLVYCLPMRTLVEQTYSAVAGWLQAAGLSDEVELHMLMGGTVSNRWDNHPEKDCILIGTQDQLLSRALNRGYGMSRYRWPIHFALLNNDCLWVMDEVQLMGPSLQTTAQLQGFREQFQTYGPVQSLWMSATLDQDLLQTVDYPADLSNCHELTDDDKQHPVLKQRIQARKRLLQAQTICEGKDDTYAKTLAAEVIEAHVSDSLTIVICNQVPRAQEVYKAVRKQSEQPVILIHSRFRPRERRSLNQKLLDTGFKSGILIATQAIEAGVDISARVMFTELAPWSSLVQRFGRCNRDGQCSEEATIYWIDISDLKKSGRPYSAEQLEIARDLLQPLLDVGPTALQEIKLPPASLEGLIPRRHDLIQLFDTSTDLAGHDIDVSPFIREADNADITIAWRTWEGNQPPSGLGSLQRDELCQVSIHRAKSLLEALKKKKHRAWVWNGLSGAWVTVDSQAIFPGMSILLSCDEDGGGYSEELGFTGNVNDRPQAVSLNTIIEADQDASDPLTYAAGEYITLIQHAEDVAQEVKHLCQKLPDYSLPIGLLERAGRWHDLGKAHPAFQDMLTQDQPDKKESGPWAKSDHKSQMQRARRGFRHELVSALIALQQGEPFLLTYLVAAHHGKVRMTIQPRPNEYKPSPGQRYALGVWEGDKVPSVDLGQNLQIDAQTISLACMEFGSGEHGESWSAQAIALLDNDDYGPFKLAFLEALIRIADWRGSAKRAPHLLEQTDA